MVDNALMSRLEAVRVDIACSAYDPSGPGAELEADGYSQCAACGFTKTEHVLTLTVEEDEILAALHVFDAQYQVATTDQHGFRVRPASKGGIREVFFLAGAEWYKRRIEAQLAGRSDAATTTDDGDDSASDRTGE